MLSLPNVPKHARTPWISTQTTPTSHKQLDQHINTFKTQIRALILKMGGRVVTIVDRFLWIWQNLLKSPVNSYYEKLLSREESTFPLISLYEHVFAFLLMNFIAL